MSKDSVPESVESSVLVSVCGGMSAGQAACRGAGAVLGGIGGAAANLAGFGAATNGPAIASGVANIASGVLNAGSSTSHGMTSFDTVMGLAGAVPLVGAPASAYNGAKLGWKAGGALCGYGWNSK